MSAGQDLSQPGNCREGTSITEVHLDPGAGAVKAVMLARDRPDDCQAGVAEIFEEDALVSGWLKVRKWSSRGVAKRTRSDSCQELFPFLAAAPHWFPPDVQSS